MSKPFSWSWSRLKNWRTCPKRHWHVDIEKDFVEEEGDALKWGHEVHAAMANRIGKGTPLPEAMAHYEDWPTRFAKLKSKARVLVENKLAMGKDFQKTSFFDSATWFRGVVDALALVPQSSFAIAIDWKTGANVNPEYEQLGLNAQLIFANHPEIDRVATIYVWLGHDTQTVHSYQRDEMLSLWNGLMPEVKKLEEAHRTVTYPPKPSGLCKRHCPVTSCPYHGRGSR